MLMNPIAAVGSAYVSWRFFEDRISTSSILLNTLLWLLIFLGTEELTLLEQFGEDYQRYRATTPVGIPFIK